MQHPLAKRVGGVDGGGIESGQRGPEAVATGPHLVVGCGGEESDQRVVDRRHDAAVDPSGEAGFGADHALTNPVTEFAGGHAGEGDEQQFFERGDTLGDVAGGQGGDGERLARSGAGLEHGHPHRQRPQYIEGLHRMWSSCSWSSSALQKRKA